MTSQSIALAIRPRGKPIRHLPSEVSLPARSSAADLYRSIATNARSSVHRLRITKGSDGSLIPNSPTLVLSSTGLRDQSSIFVKDLGPQIPWRTVFLVEYLGPILIHPLCYSRLANPSSAQTLSVILITSHFIKRELETLFIHRFSTATMPLSNIFKNSAHYWLLAGLNMAYWIYQPTTNKPPPLTSTIIYPALLLYIIGQLGNLHAHLTLRNLRPAGTTERGIPRGGAFEIVTCPNYMYEALVWLAVGMLTQSISAVLFAVVAIAQMGRWAQKKEDKYRREFGAKGYRPKRFVMLPGIW